MPAVRKRLTLASVLAVVASGLSLVSTAAPASAASPGLVINEIYVNGGSVGATYVNKFIELYNPTSSAVTGFTGSVQYRSYSSTAAATGLIPLTNVSVPAGGHLLIGMKGNSTNGAAIPTPDVYDESFSAAGSANGGQFFLTTSTVKVNPTADSGLIDLVGYGNATTAEGTPKAAGYDVTHSLSRTNGVDTDDNSADFTSITPPTPTNSSGNATPLVLASVTAKSGAVGAAITAFDLVASGGKAPYSYAASGLPDGVSVDAATGRVSGTPTAVCACSVTATVTDAAGSVKSQTFTFKVSAFAVTNPGSKAFSQGEPIAPFAIVANGGVEPYTYAVTAGALPTGLTLDAATGQISGTPTTKQAAADVTITVTDADGATASTTFSIAVSALLSIAEIQGTAGRSTYAPAAGTAQGTELVTTTGVITALYTKGFASSGAATCGLCGFYLQTPGSPDTDGASDAIFVYGFGGFTGAGLAVGDSVRVSGKVSEFAASGDTESLTELNLVGGVTAIADLGDVSPLTAVPAYAEREAHEGELFAPTDLVITDNYNFESFGELGLATGGRPLVQPTEQCEASDTGCITAAQQEIKDRGVFFEDGTSTNFLPTVNGSSTFYHPQNSPNSDIPLPFIDRSHSARVGARLSFPAGTGGVLDYRNKKWYLQPQRAVSSTHDGAPDLGDDVVTIEDTRPENAAPQDVGGDLKVATYNVENYFNITGKAFAEANPYYTCEWDDDRGGANILTFQCTSPQAIPTAWDPVTGAPTAYKKGVVSAPRGAARQEDLDRQTTKIVKAINGLDADVVSLEELGNVNKLRTGVTRGPLNPDPELPDQGLGTPIAWRDSSIDYLVRHLNEDAGSAVWGFVASPQEATDATSVAGMCATKQPNGAPVDGPAQTAGTCSWASGQDVIRSGFLYKRASVVPVGQSDLDLPGSSAPTPSPFDNAREPLAQYFKPVGHPNSDGFAVIVSHFKSKGDSDPKATGDNANDPLVGAFNGDRTRQAKELLRFADEFAARWKTERVFLVGDFNAYTGEDPVQTVLHDPANTLGFDLVTSEDPDDLTYVFTTTVDGIGYGGAGSLDHVFASQALRDSITGSDVWEINSNEPGVYNYGRYNNNKTDFWDGSVPFGGSDHNPEIIGFDVPDSAPVTDVQIIGSNDFHGRLLGSSSDGGAAQLAGAVKSLKATYGQQNSIFVAAGDLIGASTFESFVQQDKPTLEALNAAGLEVSAVGNHEFDRGYRDLLDRVMKPYDADTNPYGAQGGLNWQYIGSNVVYHADPDGEGPKQAGDPIVMPTATKTVGGVRIGFVGAVTEDLLGLVDPARMDGVDVAPIVSSVNAYAERLKGDGAQLVVLLLHEGAPSTDCASMTSGDGSFARVLRGIDDDVDAVVSGHTHLQYACTFPVAGWADRPITERPVVSAGQYGVALDQLVYSFDAAGEPVDVVTTNVGVKGPGSTLFSYPEDPQVKQIVADAVTAAQGPGARVLGKIAGPFNRARLADGSTENRGGESTLGNLVAEIQRWATPETAGIDGAQIAFMNPGGLRADLRGTGDDGAREVTYREAAGVQPFANTLVNLDLSGAQIRAALEQQWQRDAAGNVPSRPFLKLGTSQGFSYTYRERPDPDHAGARLGQVTGMWLHGKALRDDVRYSVTVNSFLAAGGDNFRAFAGGVDKRDTGITDLQAQVDYMAHRATTPLPVDARQHSVGFAPVADQPATYHPGDAFDAELSSLAMTGGGEAHDSEVEIYLGDRRVATATVDNGRRGVPDDEAGTAVVRFTVPEDFDDSDRLVLRGTTTGTEIELPARFDDGKTDTAVTAPDLGVERGQTATVSATVTPAEAMGSVEVREGSTLLGTGEVVNGTAAVAIDSASLAPGAHELTVRYLGSAQHSSSTDTLVLTVRKASAAIEAEPVTATWGAPTTVTVHLPADATGTVSVHRGETDYGTATVQNGLAALTIAAGELPVGDYELTATYAGDATYAEDADDFPVTVAKADPKVAAPDVTMSYGRSAAVRVTLDPRATGAVQVRAGSRVIASANALEGVATVILPARSLPPGRSVLTASYAGDEHFVADADTLIVTVPKVASALRVTHVPGRPKVRQRVVLAITVTAAGITPTGSVRITGTAGGTRTVRLVKGRARVTLPGWRSDGTKRLKVTYPGSAQVGGRSVRHAVSVRRR